MATRARSIAHDAAAKASAKAVAVTQQGDAPVPSKLPNALRFPLVVTLSLFLSSLLYSIAGEYTANDLASVSRRLDKWYEVGALLSLRVVELAMGWWGGLDGFDVAGLGIIGRGPVVSSA